MKNLIHILILVGLLSWGSLPAQTLSSNKYLTNNGSVWGTDIARDGVGYAMTGRIWSPLSEERNLFFKLDSNFNPLTATKLKRVSPDLNFGGNDIVSCPGGSFLVPGNFDGFIGGDYFRSTGIVHLDSAGQPLWGMEFLGNTPTSLGEITSVVPASNNSTMAGGYFRMDPGGVNYNYFVARIDNNTGVPISTNVFGSSHADAAEDIIELSNGNFLLTGLTIRPFTDESAIYLAVVDSNCNLVWSRTIDGPDEDDGICAVEDASGIVVIGESNSYNTGPYNNSGILLSRFDLNGNHLQSRIYQTNTTESIRTSTMVCTADSGYLISGDQSGTLIKLNHGLGVSWAKKYTDNWFFTTSLAYNGNYLAVGTTNFPRLGTILFEIDSSGFSGNTCAGAPMQIFSSPVSPVVTNVTDTVYSTPSTNSVTMNAVSAPMTRYGCDFVAVDPSEGLDISASPNPTRGRTRIRYSFGELRATAVEVYDLQGRMLLQKDLGTTNQGSLEIEMSGYPEGIYLLRVQAGEGIWTRKVVKF